jgi:hypothetical protein
VGEEALLEIEPEALDRVEFWRIGRQVNESDVVGDLSRPVTYHPALSSTCTTWTSVGRLWATVSR